MAHCPCLYRQVFPGVRSSSLVGTPKRARISLSLWPTRLMRGATLSSRSAGGGSRTLAMAGLLATALGRVAV